MKHLLTRQLRSKPYARICTRQRTKPYAKGGGLGFDVYLYLNSATVRVYGLKARERVDVLWDSFDKTWERPVLVIKRNGNERALSGTANSDWLRMAMAQPVLEFGIPMLKNKLPILDYIDGELWIDFSDGMDDQVVTPREAKLARGSIIFTDQSKIDYRISYSLRDKINLVAKEEGLSANALLHKLVELYIEDYYPNIWRGK